MRTAFNVLTALANKLGFNSQEGGYIGTTFDTHELLFEIVGLDLPRDDNGKLAGALLEFLQIDEAWCNMNTTARAR